MFEITTHDKLFSVCVYEVKDTNIDNVDNITIILAVHDYIKNSGRF